MYIYTNNKFLRKQLGVNPATWYEKKMLFKNSMFDVDKNTDESDTSDKDPLVSNENKDQHDPFEFPNDDNLNNILFSILLSNATV